MPIYWKGKTFTGWAVKADDGNGKIIGRAKLDTSDPKRIVITELPPGTNTESLTQSIEQATKSGKLKISSINDYTTNKVEIEIKLQRGVYAEDVIDALYAYTDCEMAISCNLLVIKDNMPLVMTATDVIKHSANQLTNIDFGILDAGDYEVEAETNAYVIGKADDVVAFYPLSATNRTIAQSKSFLVLPTASPVVKMNFGGESTAIETVEKVDANAPIYDLSGRRVVNMTNGGVYIQNGKKVVR